jgi:hypothetical protein
MSVLVRFISFATFHNIVMQLSRQGNGLAERITMGQLGGCAGMMQSERHYVLLRGACSINVTCIVYV